MSDYGWKNNQFLIPGVGGTPQPAIASDNAALSDARTPVAHASSHRPGGSDAIPGLENTHRVTFTNAGAALTAVASVPVQFGAAGTIQRWRITGAPSGSATLNIWKKNAAVPTVADAICDGAKPAISAAQIAGSASLGSWTTVAIAANDVIIVNIESISTFTELVFEFDVVPL